MPSTPVYALPYPALSDPPNGPAQVGSLATATEAGLTTVNANANTNARTYPRLLSARLVSNQTLGAVADVTGCTLTFTTAQTNTLVLVTVNAAVTDSSANYGLFTTQVDGVTNPVQLIAVQGSALASPSFSVTFLVTLAAAGSHTIKMQGTHSGGTTVAQANSTGISLVVVGP